MTDDHYPSYTELNASIEYAADELAEMVRRLMCAATSECSCDFESFEAGLNFATVLKCLHYDETITLTQLMDEAVIRLTVDGDRRDLDSEIVEAAKSGANYLLEASSNDSLAGARVSIQATIFLIDAEQMAKVPVPSHSSYRGCVCEDQHTSPGRSGRYRRPCFPRYAVKFGNAQLADFTGIPDPPHTFLSAKPLALCSGRRIRG